MPNLSKVFERCLHKQTSDSFDTILAKYQCGFRKGHSAHHYVIALQEKCTESIDRGLEFGIPLTDHFKAFDYLPHNLFVCRSDDKTLQFIYDYLWHCKELKLQAHIVHDKKFYMVFPKNHLWEVIFQWFRDNQFQGNATKCHVLLSTDKQVHENIGTAQIKNMQNEKLVGITTDSKLSFDKHIQQICSRTSAKLKALARIAPFMNITKRNILLNAFFNAQFSYCPLNWMFHGRKLNNKISRLHKRYLQSLEY